MKSVKQAQVSGKRVILRGDLDVPVEGGKVTDDTRLKALLPTLNYLLENKADVLVIGYLGRPKGEDPEFSTRPVAERIGELVGCEVEFVKFSDLSANSPTRRVGISKPAGFFLGGSSLAVLENTRFWPEEEDPSTSSGQAFARKIAAFGDLYVNDSFATCHRDYVSTAGLAKILPAFAGLKLQEEVKELGGVLESPKRPLVFVMGGAKTETKVPLVPEFAKVADRILLGGLLMFSQKLEGVPKVLFPVDAVEIYDIGPKSVKKFTTILKEARTIVWNGPMGKWEEKKYEKGTRKIAEELAKTDSKVIVGGGDTIAALNAFGLLSKMDYVSLGGGAMLEFLAGERLPGLEALGHY